MLIKSKYEYPALERVDLEIGRHYLDSNQKPVPSVTTVLSGTSRSKIDSFSGEIESVKKRLKESLNKVPI